MKTFDAFRIVNFIHTTDESLNAIWNFIKRIKLKSLIDSVNCYEGFVTDEYLLLMISELEDKFGVQSMTIRFENITDSTLENSADIFLYLYINNCLLSNKNFPWFLFYKVKNYFFNQNNSIYVLGSF